MARTVNEHFQAVKRSEILDAALQLISTNGYNAMAIQQLLEGLSISKGALYHYFPSKSTLLEALVDRLLLEAEQAVAPVAQDYGVGAPEVLSCFFRALARYKASHRPFIAALLPVWYSDDNAIMRDKVRVAFAGRLAPMVAGIIRRGCEEGAFSVSSPGQTGRLVLCLTQELADALVRLLLSGNAKPNIAVQIEQMVAATTEAVERVLGAPAGSVRLVEPGDLDVWLALSEGEPG